MQPAARISIGSRRDSSHGDATPVEQRERRTRANATPPRVAFRVSMRPMSLKMSGELQLKHSETDQSILTFTKALQEAEKQNNPITVGVGLKNRGRAFLAKEEWAKATKIFNGAYAKFLNTPEENHRQSALKLMADVEKCFLEKV